MGMYDGYGDDGQEAVWLGVLWWWGFVWWAKMFFLGGADILYEAKMVKRLKWCLRGGV